MLTHRDSIRGRRGVVKGVGGRKLKKIKPFRIKGLGGVGRETPSMGEVPSRGHVLRLLILKGLEVEMRGWVVLVSIY